MQRDQQREEREKQRAKDEVARLNGEVPGSSAKDPPWKKKSAGGGGAPPPMQASVEERKRQMQQLADMGVAIPEEYRRDMAMVGDWQVIAQTAVRSQRMKKEESGDEDKSEVKSVGVRKRRLDEGEEEEEAVGRPAQKVWGSAFKAYPGSKAKEEDLDALLGGTKAAVQTESVVKEEDAPELPIKREDEAQYTNTAPAVAKPEADDQVKLQDAEAALPAEAPAAGSGVVFKKRKKKS